MHNEAPRLFPFPHVEGVEGLFARHSRTGRRIYLAVVLALLAAACCLPLVRVEVNSQSRGILRPARKLAPVISPAGGLVTFLRMEDDLPVCTGDTLAVISTATLEGEQQHLESRRREQDELLADLTTLANADPGEHPRLYTAVYQRDFLDYRRRLDEVGLRLNHAERHRDRQRELLETGSVARMEVEQAEHDVQLILAQRRQLREQQRHLWTQELQRIGREAADVAKELRQSRQRASEYVVRATVDGHLTKTQGIQVGNYLQTGQTVAQISPDGDLRVEAFVSPTDIGLLRVGLPVRVQLDAFNYNQWGLARATLSEIGTDVTEVDGQAAFRVLCTLHDDRLSLKNGYVGRLRKGMTLTAHFTLTRRSLLQLLHDKLDDWFNPVYH